jgi:hypothetical protein
MKLIYIVQKSMAFLKRWKGNWELKSLTLMNYLMLLLKS